MVQESTNTFDGGLISDLNPLTTPNNVLTDALNATLLTFNGNELVLQNDMGNTKITGAKLKDGFIPIGMKEDGGILYIISHNPSTKETEIGSFPSPSEISENDLDPVIITPEIELKIDGSTLNKNIQITSKKLNSGDSFLIFLKNGVDDDGEIFNLISSYDQSIRNFYKIKLISIENGVETDITNTLDNQYKLIKWELVDGEITNVQFIKQNYWFIPLDNSESIPNKESTDYKLYRTNKHIQRFKARKGGKLYLKFITEDIDQFYINNDTRFPILTSNDNNTGYQLDFKFHLKALSLLQPDRIDIKLQLIDLNGIDADLTINYPPIELTMNRSITEVNTDLISIDIGTDYNKIAIYTITPRSEKYGITFDNFIIEDIIDLSSDPLQWTSSANAEYNFYDYDFLDYNTI